MQYNEIHNLTESIYVFINGLTIHQIIKFSPLIAASVLIYSFIPLIKKITTNKSVEGISLKMLLLGILQCICFCAFDFANQRHFQLVCFIILLFLFTVLLNFYYIYSFHRKKYFYIAGIYLFFTALLLMIFPTNIIYTAPKNLWIYIGYFGFLFGAFRVVPQTLVTLKTKNINNLSYTFFSLHLLAGCIGLNFELQTSGVQSASHILFFVMVVITNSIQLIYMKTLSLRQAYTENIRS